MDRGLRHFSNAPTSVRRSRWPRAIPWRASAGSKSVRSGRRSDALTPNDSTSRLTARRLRHPRSRGDHRVRRRPWPHARPRREHVAHAEHDSAGKRRLHRASSRRQVHEERVSAARQTAPAIRQLPRRAAAVRRMAAQYPGATASATSAHSRSERPLLSRRPGRGAAALRHDR